MKDAKEILFEQYQSDGANGLKPLTDADILRAMEIYAKERAVWFALKRDPTLSKFEIERLYDIHMESEPF